MRRRWSDRSSRRVRTLVTQLARSRLVRESGRMRADIHDGPEQTLQSEAGYSNARPHQPGSTKPLAPHGRTIQLGQSRRGRCRCAPPTSAMPRKRTEIHVTAIRCFGPRGDINRPSLYQPMSWLAGRSNHLRAGGRMVMRSTVVGHSGSRLVNPRVIEGTSCSAASCCGCCCCCAARPSSRSACLRLSAAILRNAAPSPSLLKLRANARQRSASSRNRVTSVIDVPYR